MTPKAKEKAIELVNEFQSISGHTRFSKAYALIAAREIIKDLEDLVKWRKVYTHTPRVSLQLP
jgi:hypothetical protein